MTDLSCVQLRKMRYSIPEVRSFLSVSPRIHSPQKDSWAPGGQGAGIRGICAPHWHLHCPATFLRKKEISLKRCVFGPTTGKRCRVKSYCGALESLARPSLTQSSRLARPRTEFV